MATKPVDKSAQRRVRQGELEGEGYVDDLVGDERCISTNLVFSPRKPSADLCDPSSEAELYARGCADDLYD